MREEKSLSWALIFIVALVLRAIPILLTLHKGIGLDDMIQYDMLARSILSGRGFTWYGGIHTSHRAPLYPLFLAAIYFLFGHSFLAARVTHAFIGAGLCVLVYFIARSIFNSKVASIASVILALYTILLLYPLALVTENLFLPLLTLSIASLIRAIRNPRPANYALSGLLLGLSMLTRSVISGFVPLILIWLWRYSPGKKEAFKNWAIMLLFVLMLTLPWIVRNSVLHGQFVFIESSFGFNFYLGYHPDSTGTFDTYIADDLITIIDDAERNRVGLRMGLAFIRKNPARVFYLAIRKLSYFWGLEKRGVIYFYSNNYFGHLPLWFLLLAFLLIVSPLAIVIPFSVVGVVFSEPSKETALILLLCFYYMAVHMLILAEPRFHLPLVPFLSILAAKGYTSLPAIRNSLEDPTIRRSAKAKLIWCLGIVALFFLNWAYELWSDMDKLKIIFSPMGNESYFPY